MEKHSSSVHWIPQILTPNAQIVWFSNRVDALIWHQLTQEPFRHLFDCWQRELHQFFMQTREGRDSTEYELKAMEHDENVDEILHHIFRIIPSLKPIHYSIIEHFSQVPSSDIFLQRWWHEWVMDARYSIPIGINNANNGKTYTDWYPQNQKGNDDFSHFDKTRHISISDYFLDVIKRRDLAELNQHLWSIRSFELSFCDFTEFRLLLLELFSWPIGKVRIAKFCDVRLAGLSYTALVEIFSKLNCVEYLEISGGELNYLSKEQLYAICTPRQTLKSLEISWMNFPQMTSWDFFLLFGGFSSLRRLDLNNSTCFEKAQEHASALGEIFSRLDSLSLAYSDLDELSPTLRTYLFQSLFHLKFADFSGINFSNFPKEHLNGMFAPLWNLRELLLKRCSIGNMDHWQLQAVFSPLSQLQTINLYDNELNRFSLNHLKYLFSLLPALEKAIIYSNALDLETKNTLQESLPSIHFL